LIELNYAGEALQPATWCPIGLPYWNPGQAAYSLDLTKAEEEFKLAWSGHVWENGFKLIATFPTSSLDSYWNIYYQLKTSIESLNPKFHVEFESLNWVNYTKGASWRQLPLFSIGWVADCADPDSFVRPFMHSTDYFASWQGYNNQTVDDLIEEGRNTLDVTRRTQIYKELQRIYHNEAPSVPITQTVHAHFERDWVRGWYYNPSYPGFYFYPLWKQDWLTGDIDFDGQVEMKDISTVAKAFGAAYGPPMHPRWNFRCDINNDRKIDMKDIGIVAKNFGTHT
jgi:peptide/nickel transport system substrate-binding protein